MTGAQNPPAAAAVEVLASTGLDGQWTPVTLELLSDASALAARWQGQVGVCVLAAAAPPPAALAELAAHGGDFIHILYGERFAHWCSEAITAALASQVGPECNVVLLPAGAHGEEVAALLAVRLETDWLADALTLAVTRTGALEITATLPGGKLSRLHRPPIGKPVIVTMRPGVAEIRKRDRYEAPDVRSVTVDLGEVPVLTVVKKHLPADPKTVDLVHAERIVSAGRGAGGPEGLRLVAALADDLGAAVGVSRLIVDLGWAPSERQVGLTGRTVRPDLYVASGISGASHHVAGMRESRHIVAINPDRKAPIHAVAHLSLVGDLHQVIPAIRAALQRRRENCKVAGTIRVP